MEVRTLDVENFGRQTVKVGYPYVEITRFNESLPVVVSSLSEGDMSLTAEYKGTVKIVKRISPSAFNIDKLIRTGQELEVHVSSEVAVIVKSVAEYLGVI